MFLNLNNHSISKAFSEVLIISDKFLTILESPSSTSQIF